MILLLLGISLLCCDSVAAECRMKNYVEELLVGNAELQAAYNQWQAAVSRIGYSNALPDPRFSYGHFIKEVETRVGPQKQRLGISQKIPWLGKLKYRKGVATKTAFVAEEQIYAHQTHLIHQLRKLFFDLHFIKRAIEITAENKRLLHLIEQVTQSQVRGGGSTADVLQAQMEISTLHYHLESLHERAASVTARINALLNREVSCSLTEPDDLFDHLSSPKRLSDENLAQSNPQLRILTAEIGQKQELRHLAHQNYFPDVTIGLDWIQTDHALTPTPESGKDPVVAKISLNLPIWHGDYKAQENEAEHRVCAMEQQFKQKQYILQAEVEDVVLKYQDANRHVLLFQDVLIPQAKQTLEILKDAYETGQADFERYIGVQRELLDFQLKLEKAIKDKASMIADYDALIGRVN